MHSRWLSGEASTDFLWEVHGLLAANQVVKTAYYEDRELFSGNTFFLDFAPVGQDEVQFRAEWGKDEIPDGKRDYGVYLRIEAQGLALLWSPVVVHCWREPCAALGNITDAAKRILSHLEELAGGVSSGTPPFDYPEPIRRAFKELSEKRARFREAMRAGKRN
ncbi:MAG: hypothetical protein Q7S03_03110 [bacterium]|nr:hypothetical protein [bacterium]